MIIKLYKIEIVLAIILLIGFLFYFIPAPNNIIRIQDEFDGNFTSRHLIVNSGDFFEINPTKIVYGTMNGLPRANFVRFSEPIAFLMFLFGSLTGYAIAFIFIHLVAFFGIYLIGKQFLNVKKENLGILVLISLCFACLPFNASYCLSVSGIPIAFLAFLNIYFKRNIKISLLTLIGFAICSNFVLVGFHLCVIFGLLSLYFSLKEKKIQWLLFLSIFLAAITYVMSEYMMFYEHLFNHDYQSSRQAFDKELTLNFKGVVGVTFIHLFSGEYNAANYLGYIFIPFILYYVAYVIKVKKNKINSIGLLMIITFLTCGFLSTVFDWTKMDFFFETFGFAKIFNLKRFILIVPGLFFIVLVFALLTINRAKKEIPHIITLVTLLVFFVFLWRGNISRSRSSYNCNGLEISGEDNLTFNQFFDETIYMRIKKDIGFDSVNNVINYGLLPSPCKYFGFHVLDDYQGDYPLKYKQEFRKIISKEIEKSNVYKGLFDCWGSMCYLLSANEVEDKLKSINGFAFEPRLDINTNQLKKMNCKYILSSIIIGNSNQLNLRFEKVYVSSITNTYILLYKLI